MQEPNILTRGKLKDDEPDASKLSSKQHTFSQGHQQNVDRFGTSTRHMGDRTDLQSLMNQKATVISTNEESPQGSIHSMKEKEPSCTTTGQKVNVTDKLQLKTRSPEQKVQDSAVANITMNVSDVSQRDTLQQASSPNVSTQGTKSDQVTPQAKGRGRFARSASKLRQFATN